MNTLEIAKEVIDLKVFSSNRFLFNEKKCEIKGNTTVLEISRGVEINTMSRVIIPYMATSSEERNTPIIHKSA